MIGPSSVFHITQLEVLLEDRHFHTLTYRATQELLAEGFLRHEEVSTEVGVFVIVWKSGVRYLSRAIKAHIALALEYASPLITRATGDYADC